MQKAFAANTSHFYNAVEFSVIIYMVLITKFKASRGGILIPLYKLESKAHRG